MLFVRDFDGCTVLALRPPPNKGHSVVNTTPFSNNKEHRYGNIATEVGTTWPTALKQQISKFYPHITSTEASCHIHGLS